MVAELLWQSPAPRAARWVSARWKGGVEALQAAALQLQWAWLPVIGNGNLLQICLSVSPCWQWTLSRRHNRRRAQMIEQLPTFVWILRRPVPRSPPIPPTASSTPLPPRFLSRDWDGNAFLHSHLNVLCCIRPFTAAQAIIVSRRRSHRIRLRTSLRIKAPHLV